MEALTATAPRTAEPDDAALVAAVARRDDKAFARLLDRHLVPVHRLAFRMLGDASEAEDVAQETFVRFWDGAARWRAQGGGLPAWLRRVATNLCFDQLRRRARLAEGGPDERLDPSPPADRVLDDRRLAATAAAMLAGLPDRQRAAIVLTYYEELPNLEAAAAMDLHVKAFESLLLRARAALRQRLTGAGVSGADLGAPA